MVATTLAGCSEPARSCESTGGECQPFAEILNAVPVDVRDDDWEAAATIAHAQARAVIGKYFTGEVTVLRGTASAIDRAGGFEDDIVLATLAFVERSRHSNRADLCQFAIFSEAAGRRIILEQPNAEPGVTYFSTVASFWAAGGLLLSCTDCLPNLCELPLGSALQVDELLVTGTYLDGSPAQVELRAVLAPVDPWGLSKADLRTLSSIYWWEDRAHVQRLDACAGGLSVGSLGGSYQELPVPPDSDFYACARKLSYTYTIYVDPACPEVYGVRDLRLSAPQRCCWYFDCIECAEPCEPWD